MPGFGKSGTSRISFLRSSMAKLTWYNSTMPTFRVDTPQRCYPVMVERGAIGHAAQFIPAKTGKVFVISTEEVWRHQGETLASSLPGACEILHLPGGEDKKRLAPIEEIAEQMVLRGGDRSSLVIAFGGGIVNDMAGFIA